MKKTYYLTNAIKNLKPISDILYLPTQLLCFLIEGDKKTNLKSSLKFIPSFWSF